MAKQAKPKVSELVEILIQQMDEFQKVTNERNEVLSNSISKLKYLKVDFNVAELEAMKQSNRAILKKDFANFHAQTSKNNKELLRAHKKVSSSKLLYVTVLNILIFLSAITMLYVTFHGSQNKSQFESLMIENNRLKNKDESIDRFFNENQEVALKYEEWLKK
jgi:ATP/ADP translocase